MSQSSIWKFVFTGPNQILEYIFNIVLKKNWKIDWSEQSLTPENLKFEQKIQVQGP